MRSRNCEWFSRSGLYKVRDTELTYIRLHFSSMRSPGNPTMRFKKVVRATPGRVNTTTSPNIGGSVLYGFCLIDIRFPSENEGIMLSPLTVKVLNLPHRYQRFNLVISLIILFANMSAILPGSD